MRFVHLTDPHLVRPGQRLYGLDPNARLRTAIADINARAADAAFVVVTGDLAHDGEAAAYRSLRDALGELALPWHLLLGNHDDRAAFRAVFPEVPVDGDGFVQSVVATGAGPLVLLDTNEPGTHAGHLCARRLAWLDRALAGPTGQGMLLAMHHPPLALGMPVMDTIALVQQAELAEIVGRHGNVRHVLFGHVHRPVHGSWLGISFSTLRGLNHQVAWHEAGMCGCPGSHEPPAYAVIAVDDRSVVVHVHDFLDASARFDLEDRSAERATSAAGLPG